MLLLSIDPGSVQSGWATFCNGEYMESGVLPCTTTTQVFSFVSDLVAASRAIGESVTGVVEEQFYRGGFASLMVLLKNRFAWETAMEYYGVPVMGVYPSAWQSYWLSGIPKEAIKGAKRKKVLRSLASGDSLKNMDFDECDAYLMGVHQLRLQEAADDR